MSQKLPIKRVMKSVYEYSDYRLFLKERFAALQAQDSKLTHRAFARAVGFKSHSFFMHIVEGERNISQATIEAMAKVFGLNAEETHFFKNLVFFNQSKDADERQVYLRQLLLSQGFAKVHPLSAAQYRYYTHWYYVVIREMVALKNFQENPERISEILTTVSPAEVTSAIGELVAMGLLARDEHGKLFQPEKHLRTSSDVDAALSSPLLISFHKEMIRLGSEAIGRFSGKDREIAALTFVMPKKSMGKMKELISRFRREVADLMAAEGEPDSVFQLNIQLFPVAQDTEEEKNEAA